MRNSVTKEEDLFTSLGADGQTGSLGACMFILCILWFIARNKRTVLRPPVDIAIDLIVGLVSSS